MQHDAIRCNQRNQPQAASLTAFSAGLLDYGVGVRNQTPVGFMGLDPQSSTGQLATLATYSGLGRRAMAKFADGFATDRNSTDKYKTNEVPQEILESVFCATPF